MATLKLMRFEERTDIHAEMVVFLNGEALGSLRNGETKIFELPAGSHKIKIKTESAGSKNYAFCIAADETKELGLSYRKTTTLGPLVSGLFLIDFIVNGFLVWYYSVIRENRLIQIEGLNKWWLKI